MTFTDYTTRIITPQHVKKGSNMYVIELSTNRSIEFIDGVCKNGIYVFLGYTYNIPIIIHSRDLVTFEIIEFQNHRINNTTESMGIKWEGMHPVVWFENLLLTIFMEYNPLVITNAFTSSNNDLILYHTETDVTLNSSRFHNLTSNGYIGPGTVRIDIDYDGCDNPKLIMLDEHNGLIYNLCGNLIQFNSQDTYDEPICADESFQTAIMNISTEMCLNHQRDLIFNSVAYADDIRVIFTTSFYSRILMYKRIDQDWRQVDLNYKNARWKDIVYFKNRIIVCGVYTKPSSGPSEEKSVIAWLNIRHNMHEEDITTDWKFIDIQGEGVVIETFGIVTLKDGSEKLLCHGLHGHCIVCNLETSEFNSLRRFPMVHGTMLTRLFNPNTYQHVCVAYGGTIWFYNGRSL